MLRCTLRTEDETRRLAEACARVFRGGDIVWLIGPLGIGKTAFVRFVIRALGGQRRVPSPTFLLRVTYPVRRRGIARLHHLDAFRLRRPDPSFLAEVAELTADRQAVTAIEWADRLRRFLPPPAWRIEGQYTKDGGRQFAVAAEPDRLRRLSRLITPSTPARWLPVARGAHPRRSSPSGRGRRPVRAR